ncbi:MAG: hypothetical protein R2713_23755 [Ilumatobacteraceae bacterium]
MVFRIPRPQQLRARDFRFIFGDACTVVLGAPTTPSPTGLPWQVLGTKLATQFSNNIHNDFGFLNSSEDRTGDDRIYELIFRGAASGCSRRCRRWWRRTSAITWRRWPSTRRPSDGSGCTRPT